MNNNQPDLLTVREVAEILRMNKDVAYRSLPSMGIPIIRLSERRIRIPRDAFYAWLENQKIRTDV